MTRLILASNSPRRKELLKDIGYSFEVIPSNFNEIINKNNPIKITNKELIITAKIIETKTNKILITFKEGKVLKNTNPIKNPKIIYKANLINEPPIWLANEYPI